LITQSSSITVTMPPTLNIKIGTSARVPKVSKICGVPTISKTRRMKITNIRFIAAKPRATFAAVILCGVRLDRALAAARDAFFGPGVLVNFLAAGMSA
jgi:hypothetical protein